MKENINNTGIRFSGFLFDPDEISKRLGLEPKESGLKGEEYFIGPPDNKVSNFYKENVWDFFWQRESNDWINEQIDEFIKDIVAPRKDLIREISAESQCVITVSQYLYDGWNPGFHFSTELLSIISDIGAELDIDIYCLAGAVK